LHRVPGATQTFAEGFAAAKRLNNTGLHNNSAADISEYVMKVVGIHLQLLDITVVNNGRVKFRVGSYS